MAQWVCVHTCLSGVVFCVVLMCFPLSGYSQNSEDEPVFSENIPNVTVAVGRDARMNCVVERLGSYRVAWLRVESKTILTIHRHVITRNYRINLSHSDHKNWVLHINNVQETDRGGYMCQVNTVPMKSQVGYLDVVVAPDIVDTESSSDVLVREGSNVTLTCRAKGYPTPTITWRREDAQAVAVGNWQSNKITDTTYEGEELSITKVSRLHMGAYLCIASNNVPPSVSRRILLQVHFPPMIWIPNQLVGAPLGGQVTIDCHTEAYPMSINYWTKEEGDMIISNEKYWTSMKDKTYKIHMKLSIKALIPDDFGTYKCFAKNSLGSTEGSIRLYEIHVSPQPVKEPSTAKIQSIDGSTSEGKFEMSDDTLTKEQNLRPRAPNTPNGNSVESGVSSCFAVKSFLRTIIISNFCAVLSTTSFLLGT